MAAQTQSRTVYYFKEGLLREGLMTKDVNTSTVATIRQAFPGQEVWFMSGNVWQQPRDSMPPPRGQIDELEGIIVKLAIPFVRGDASEQGSRSRNCAGAAADGITRVVGSWKFIFCQVVVLVLWIALNAKFTWGWDRSPFYLLNLILSFQAAFTGPVIMVSQNRQGERDRQKSVDLHEKVDHLRLTELWDIWEAVTSMDRQLDDVRGLLGIPPPPSAIPHTPAVGAAHTVSETSTNTGAMTVLQTPSAPSPPTLIPPSHSPAGLDAIGEAVESEAETPPPLDEEKPLDVDAIELQDQPPEYTTVPAPHLTTLRARRSGRNSEYSSTGMFTTESEDN